MTELELLTAIDAATTDLGLKIDTEASAITDVATDVDKLRAQLAASGTSQGTLDALASLSSRISAAGASIASHTLSLRAIAADPANPVPVTVAPTATPESTEPTTPTP